MPINHLHRPKGRQRTDNTHRCLERFLTFVAGVADMGGFPVTGPGTLRMPVVGSSHSDSLAGGDIARALGAIRLPAGGLLGAPVGVTPIALRTALFVLLADGRRVRGALSLPPLKMAPPASPSRFLFLP